MSAARSASSRDANRLPCLDWHSSARHAIHRRPQISWLPQCLPFGSGHGVMDTAERISPVVARRSVERASDRWPIKACPARPVVASDIGRLRQVVDNGVTSDARSAGCKNSVANMLDSFLQPTQETRQKMAARAELRARQFEAAVWSHVSSQIFEDVLRRRAASSGATTKADVCSPSSDCRRARLSIKARLDPARDQALGRIQLDVVMACRHARSTGCNVSAAGRLAIAPTVCAPSQATPTPTIS